jgi:hypothetical protein
MISNRPHSASARTTDLQRVRAEHRLRIRRHIHVHVLATVLDYGSVHVVPCEFVAFWWWTYAFVVFFVSINSTMAWFCSPNPFLASFAPNLTTSPCWSFTQVTVDKTVQPNPKMVRPDCQEDCLGHSICWAHSPKKHQLYRSIDETIIGWSSSVMNHRSSVYLDCKKASSPLCRNLNTQDCRIKISAKCVNSRSSSTWNQKKKGEECHAQ